MNNIVYIVDDDVAVRDSLAFFLRSAGFGVQTFADPDHFATTADVLEPGCVLLDLRMPVTDGFAVLAALAARRAQLPVVMMTGHGDVVTAVRAMKLGAVDFLEKPFEEAMLLGILEHVFDALGGNRREADRRRDAHTRLARLSDRERVVLQGLIAGKPNKILAYDLGISIRTVEMHRAAMMDRLGVRTFADALRLAFDGGFDLAGDGARSAPSTAAAR